MEEDTPRFPLDEKVQESKVATGTGGEFLVKVEHQLQHEHIETSEKRSRPIIDSKNPTEDPFVAFDCIFDPMLQKTESTDLNQLLFNKARRLDKGGPVQLLANAIWHKFDYEHDNELPTLSTTVPSNGEYKNDSLIQLLPKAPALTVRTSPVKETTLGPESGKSHSVYPTSVTSETNTPSKLDSELLSDLDTNMQSSVSSDSQPDHDHTSDGEDVDCELDSLSTIRNDADMASQNTGGADDEKEPKEAPGDTSAGATRTKRRRPRNRHNPPRPLNSFILYRKDFHMKVLAETGAKVCNNEVSKILSKRWREEPEHVKAKYKELAEKAKEEHKKMYPDYRYQPRKAKPRRRKKNDNDQAFPEKGMLVMPVGLPLTNTVTSALNPNISTAPLMYMMPQQAVHHHHHYRHMPLDTKHKTQHGQLVDYDAFGKCIVNRQPSAGVNSLDQTSGISASEMQPALDHVADKIATHAQISPQAFDAVRMHNERWVTMNSKESDVQVSQPRRGAQPIISSSALASAIHKIASANAASKSTSELLGTLNLTFDERAAVESAFEGVKHSSILSDGATRVHPFYRASPTQHSPPNDAQSTSPDSARYQNAGSSASSHNFQVPFGSVCHNTPEHVNGVFFNQQRNQLHSLVNEGGLHINASSSRSASAEGEMAPLNLGQCPARYMQMCQPEQRLYDSHFNNSGKLASLFDHGAQSSSHNLAHSSLYSNYPEGKATAGRMHPHAYEGLNSEASCQSNNFAMADSQPRSNVKANSPLSNSYRVDLNQFNS